jgi:hypothetical protein
LEIAVNDKLSSEQKATLVQNALAKLDHPAFFARLNALGIAVSEKEASEYLALGEELLALEVKQNTSGNSDISAARTALHKHAAEQGFVVAGNDYEHEIEIRQFAIAQLMSDDSIAPTLAQLDESR